VEAEHRLTPRGAPGENMKKSLLIAALQLSAMVPAWAEPCAIQPPPYRFLRFEEDYRYLRDPACRRDPWDALKLVPLDATGERFLTIGGDARLKLVSTRNVVVGDETGDNDNVALQRYHVHASLRAAPWLRTFAELKSDWVSGRVPAARAADVDRLDTHQLFADLYDARCDGARGAAGDRLRRRSTHLSAQRGEHSRELRWGDRHDVPGCMARRRIRLPAGRIQLRRWVFR
jgi:hypothetical protein